MDAQNSAKKDADDDDRGEAAAFVVSELSVAEAEGIGDFHG